LEVDSIFTLPKIKLPIYGPEYIRWPFQKGAKGVMISSDLTLDGMSGLGEGTARLTVQPNLSTGVFVPVGNTSFADTDDPNATVMYGPNGVILRDSDKKSVLTLTPKTLQYALGNYVNVYIDKDQLKLSFKNASGDCTLVMDANGIRLDAFGNEINISQNGITQTHQGGHSISLTDAGIVENTPASVSITAGANYTLNVHNDATLTADAMQITGNTTAYYDGPSGFGCQFTTAQAYLVTPWNSLSMNSSQMISQMGASSYLQITPSQLNAASGSGGQMNLYSGQAVLQASGSYYIAGSNVLNMQSSGTITINGNGQTIYLDGGTVNIMNRAFLSHTHFGVQSGGTNSGGVN
jgi:hypothetical protein